LEAKIVKLPPELFHTPQNASKLRSKQLRFWTQIVKMHPELSANLAGGELPKCV